jgi:hypothetical protein
MENHNQELRSLLAETNPDMTFCMGHDNAIMGCAAGFHEEVIVVYDTEIIIENLMQDGKTDSQARDFFDKNIANHFKQKHMPMFVDTMGVRMVPNVFEVILAKLKKTKKPRRKQ